MTENEAIYILGEKYTEIEYYFAEHDCYMGEFDAELQEAINIAIKALKEIRKYQEIGQIDEIKEMKKYYSLLKKHGTIGKEDECLEEKKRKKAKKPIIIMGKTKYDKLACCPVCDEKLDWTYDRGFWRKGNPNYCSNCG